MNELQFNLMDYNGILTRYITGEYTKIIQQLKDELTEEEYKLKRLEMNEHLLAFQYKLIESCDNFKKEAEEQLTIIRNK